MAEITVTAPRSRMYSIYTVHRVVAVGFVRVLYVRSGCTVTVVSIIPGPVLRRTGSSPFAFVGLLSSVMVMRRFTSIIRGFRPTDWSPRIVLSRIIRIILFLLSPTVNTRIIIILSRHGHGGVRWFATSVSVYSVRLIIRVITPGIVELLLIRKRGVGGWILIR